MSVAIGANWAMNIFSAMLNCVIVIIHDSHYLYSILAQIYLSFGWNKCATSLFSFSLVEYTTYL